MADWTTMDQCCGKCRWFNGSAEDIVYYRGPGSGEEVIRPAMELCILPTIPFYLQKSVASNDGERCPTFLLKGSQS